MSALTGALLSSCLDYIAAICLGLLLFNLVMFLLCFFVW